MWVARYVNVLKFNPGQVSYANKVASLSSAIYVLTLMTVRPLSIVLLAGSHKSLIYKSLIYKSLIYDNDDDGEDDCEHIVLLAG